MQFLKQWAISVCASGIIGTVFSMIAPKGSMDKILKLMISVFILTSMIVPFMTGENIEFEDFFDTSSKQAVSEDDLWQKSNELTLQTTQRSVEQSIRDFLVTKNCTECEVVVSLSVDENNYVSIESAELYLTESDQNRSAELITLTQQEFDITVKVFSIGDYDDESSKT